MFLNKHCICVTNNFYSFLNNRSENCTLLLMYFFSAFVSIGLWKQVYHIGTMDIDPLWLRTFPYIRTTDHIDQYHRWSALK